MLTLLLLTIVGGDEPGAPAPGITPPPGYTLVWNEEFDGEGLVDEARWNYEVGFIRNHEEQYYTRARVENVRQENGLLVIEGRREAWEEDGKTANYTSGSINTQGKVSWQYGRIETRAKLPRGKGVWPAIWMMGDDAAQVGWPRCGEIDIMEFVGKEPERTHSTVHWAKPEGGHTSQGGNLPVEAPWDDFHLYVLEWTAEAFDFYFDDQLIFHFDLDQANKADGTNPFRQKHWLLLNLALGGAWGGEIDPTIFPQRYEIDYVRVFQRDGQ
ncbi:MAG TPA: hypothetical protein DCZ72_12640 [Armatimonadetes bacterium]|nr:hypothetical protein [Armatimonadota bacterium]